MRALVIALVLAGGARAQEYDLVVYGGSSAGVSAAVQAARMQHSVLLIAPSGRLGGLSSGGLGMTDTGDKDAIGGLAREFYARLHAHYATDGAWRQERAEDFRWFDQAADAQWRFEPHVAERVFEELVAEHEVRVVRGWWLDRDTGVEREGAHIRALVMESGERVRGRVFLDCTYEGDLLAAAGASYHVGREARATYGERLNGVSHDQARHHQFSVPVDPYVIAGDPESGLLPNVQAEPPGETGAGDDRVQAYNFRLCLTDVPENRIAFSRPTGYDAGEYELLLRAYDAGWDRVPWSSAPMPNRKTDTNNNGCFSTDYIGANHAYPEASYAERALIVAAHERYQRGLLWTLASSERVPASVRAEVNRWGLAADEFEASGSWPHQLYVREGRRLVGDYVVTEHDCLHELVVPDPVGLGAYNMDSHNVQRYVTEAGLVRNEGDVQVAPAGSYAIAYRALLPRAEECANLLVPVCLSASHIAYGSIRMEPVFMILGQSAATAACLSLDAGVTLHALEYERLRARLLADGQRLEPRARAGAARAGIDPASLTGIVVDDEEAQLVGAWTRSSSVQPFVGRGYQHDGDPGAGARPRSARFELELPRSGRWELQLAWSAHANRAARVPVRIEAAGEVLLELELDQRQPAPLDGLWSSLAELEQDVGSVFVVVESARSGGYVVVDAARALLLD